MRIATAFALLAAALLLVSPHTSRAAYGDITLLGSTKPSGAVQVTDVWGYAADGKEYAILGDRYRGFYVIDVTNPATPFVALDYTDKGANGFDVKMWGTYVYTCNGSSSGTSSRVVDIADFANPVLSAPFAGTHNLAVIPSGYLVAEQIGMIVYDIHTNPMVPTWVFQDGFGDAHDSSPVGNRLYDFRGYLGLHVWDITNPATPVQIGPALFDPQISYYHSGYPTEDGNYVYVCDESPAVSNPDIYVWDISNLPDTAMVVSTLSDPLATVHNLYIVGNMAFVSYYASGFRVYDVSNPASPQLLDTYDTSPLAQEAFVGAFGVYPFTPSGNIYVSDMQSGLFIFSVEGATTPVAIKRFLGTFERESVRLSWEVSADEPLTGFRINRERDGRTDDITPALLLPATRSFVDDAVEHGANYTYTLAAVKADGTEVRSRQFNIAVPAWETTMGNPFPNPFNPATTIPFELSHASDINARIVDATGRLIRTLATGTMSPGPHELQWSGTDDAGNAVASGVYFVKLTAGKRSFTRQLVLLK